MAPGANTNSVESGEERPRWTRVLPAPIRSLGRPFFDKWQYLYGALSQIRRDPIAKIKQALAKTAWTISKPLARTSWGQSILGKIVVSAQYLQGIGCGSDVFSNGEAAILTRLKESADSKRALCVFDVGANKGQFLTLACTCLVGREFTIHPFEPSQNTYEQPCENARKHRNALLNNCGLGREPGELELFYDVVGSELASLTERKLDHIGLHMDLSEKVKISTIDDYCSAYQINRIDLLKIDVEGHELDVLNAGKNMFSKSAIDMVTFEFGGSILTRGPLKDFFYFFQDHQMRIARITPTGYLCELKSYKEVFEQFATTNFMCYRR
jgi:FkbM family methyltransferase